ncbi:radical SAM protein [Brachyspira murdochii]|uniref:radical SAM protein n=1 Tax=Brachyspira murdochii TaxID=84378 RepID=UPI0012F49A2E|nr:hypothetical protein [Brachyspira murdochii]
MKKISDMKIIQIDVTNACIHRCSNCTRFCGHHKKDFYMDFETFKKAVDSLDEYNGCVGMIGGEPTLHPEFEKFADYLKSKRLEQDEIKGREPIYDMQSYILKNLTKFEENRTGLWSSLNRQYYKHFETIQNSFGAQNLNDHDNKCEHQALLMPRKELGISDDEWIKKRDACWIQNTWSATITPKGAFFCEVAGSLDMLFNGPGGWEVTKDWWKRDIKDYEDQLHWCELCSGCLDVPQRISNDERDDMTPNMYQKLIDIKSPKVLKNQVVVHTVEEYNKNKNEYKTFTGDNDYMEVAGNQRFSKNNTNLIPRDIKIINKLNKNIDLGNKKEFSDWIIISNGKIDKANSLKEKMKNVVINPGCLYIDNNIYMFNVISRSIRDNLHNIKSISKLKNYYEKDRIIYISDRISFIENIFSIKDIYDNYKNKKIIRICGINITLIKK